MSEDYTPNERIIDRVVSLWIAALRDPKYDNGDRSATGFLVEAMAASLPKNNDDVTLARFGAELKIRLMTPFTSTPFWSGSMPYTRWVTDIHVDYDPDPVLEEAAKAAGLKMRFPCKTDMYFDERHVEFRQGYGAPCVMHYPMTRNRWMVTSPRSVAAHMTALLRYAETLTSTEAVDNGFFRIEEARSI